MEYSFSLFFNKLVSYTFLFWLPFYVKTTRKSPMLPTVYTRSHDSHMQITCKSHISHMYHMQTTCKSHVVYM